MNKPRAILVVFSFVALFAIGPAAFASNLPGISERLSHMVRGESPALKDKWPTTARDQRRSEIPATVNACTTSECMQPADPDPITPPPYWEGGGGSHPCSSGYEHNKVCQNTYVTPEGNERPTCVFSAYLTCKLVNRPGFPPCISCTE